MYFHGFTGKLSYKAFHSVNLIWGLVSSVLKSIARSFKSTFDLKEVGIRATEGPFIIYVMLFSGNYNLPPTLPTLRSATSDPLESEAQVNLANYKTKQKIIIIILILKIKIWKNRQRIRVWFTFYSILKNTFDSAHLNCWPFHLPALFDHDWSDRIDSIHLDSRALYGGERPGQGTYNFDYDFRHRNSNIHPGNVWVQVSLSSFSLLSYENRYTW